MKKNNGHLITFWLPVAMAILIVLTISGCSSGSNTAAETTAVISSHIQPSATAVPPGQGGMMGRASSGTLEAINGNTLTLSTGQGQASVTVNADTVYQKTLSGSTEDLQKGLILSVMGTADADSHITAASIVIRPEGQSAQFGFSGGMGPGAGGIPGGQIQPMGAFPMATGMPAQPGSGTNRGFPADGPGRQGTAGTLTETIGNTLTLTGIQGEEIKVTINADTTIQKTVKCSLSDLQKGQSLTVMGSRNNDNSLTAAAIFIQ